ncbi:tyrosine-type recombinase/integrase [Roseospira navarrensis]|nr:tyrosine-type recombinase/integrase [Roseospira navarrensis]
MKQGHVEANPWHGLTESPGQHLKRAYKFEEIRKFFQSEHVKGVLRDWMAVALFTGLRFEDAVQIKAEDLENGGVHIRGGKTEANIRWVPLSGPALSVITKRAQGRSGYVFHEVKSGNFNRRSHAISKQFGRVRDKVFGKGAGERIDAHSFRRTYAWFGEQVTDAVLLGRLMGHQGETLALRVYSAGAFVERLKEAQDAISGLIIEKTGADLWEWANDGQQGDEDHVDI